MDSIILENMEFYCYHGVLPEEQKIGGRYQVHLTLFLDLHRPAITDNLKDTVNYAQVYSLVKKHIQKSAKLIEHVAGNIVNVLFNEFPIINAVEMRLTKHNPPVNGNLPQVVVVIKRQRDER